MKHIVEKCPNVSITLDSKKSDYMLEAGGWSGKLQIHRVSAWRRGGL